MDEEQLKQLCEAVIDSMFDTAPTDERRERARIYTQEFLENKELNWDAPDAKVAREFFQDRLNMMDIEDLPKIQSVLADKHIIPNNKLSNAITADIVDAGQVTLQKTAGRGVDTHCILTYEGEDVKLLGRHPITEYDRQVMNAVCSLCVYGHKRRIMTPAMIYRHMTHDIDGTTPSKQQIAAVTKSLDKMRFIRVQVNLRDELKRRRLNLTAGQIQGGMIDTYLLAMRKIEVRAGGRKVTAYRVLEMPILYEYAKFVGGQVLTIPTEALDIWDCGVKVSNTEKRIAVKGYLLRRIKQMNSTTKAGKARMNNSILYDTIEQSVFYGELSNKERRAIKEYIDTCLTSWKLTGYIKGYAYIMSGKKRLGVEIQI